MKNLENVILGFKGGRDSDFIKYIKENDLLSYQEKELVNEIWKESGRFELWNNKSIHVGKNNAVKFMTENFPLSKKANEIIAIAISYEWL
ncbi:hypothetical protein [Flagellimonas sp. CMM7]|uniref:hypothetical protein n=1 Tax=Flagellimonas sp. CMM7 TaxID=2654676 RepID=UPI0013D67BD3|nr:hypothetical protein [Flagellimonas sp. CMM7]UII81071.1 hypothetical protein LV704_06035 [Flagellimonas sp. CMM7]